MFLGSRLGNSLLLRFTEEDQSTVITIDDSEIEKEKGKRFLFLNFNLFNILYSLLFLIVESQKKRLEEEELEVYGTGTKTAVNLTKFVFEVCDTLLNIGPIGFMTIGERINEESENDETNPENRDDFTNLELEIVTSSGHGKNGALCVLTDSIKPQTITSFELTGKIYFFLKAR